MVERGIHGVQNYSGNNEENVKKYIFFSLSCDLPFLFLNYKVYYIN